MSTAETPSVASHWTTPRLRLRPFVLGDVASSEPARLGCLTLERRPGASRHLWAWLLLFGAACTGAPAQNDEDTATEATDTEAADTEATDTEGEPAPLNVRAVLYVAKSRDLDRDEIWLRRYREESTLILASNTESAKSACVLPDGSAYVTWKHRDSVPWEVRTEGFRIDENGTELGEVVPEGFAADGCPLAWTPEQFFVNVATPTDDGVPHRVWRDGSNVRAAPVEGVSAPWLPFGRFALEEHPHPDQPYFSRDAVVWDMSGTPQPMVTWTGTPLLEVRIRGPWVLLSSSGLAPDGGPQDTADLSIVPLDDPSQPPILLREAAEPDVRSVQVGFSSSGQFVTLARSYEDVCSFELLRIADGAVQERRLIWQTSEDVDTTTPGVTDSGHLVFTSDDHQHLYVASLEESPRVIESVEHDPDSSLVWVTPLQATNNILVEVRGTTGYSYGVRSAAGGDSFDLSTPAGCRVGPVIGRDAFFRCDDGRDFMLHLLDPEAEVIRLNDFVPTPDMRQSGTREVSWAETPWYAIFFSDDETPYAPVLLQPETGETVSLYHPGFFVLDFRFLPITTP